MSSVNSIFSLSVESSLPLDCSSAGSAFTRSGGSTSTQFYSCDGYGNSTPKKKKSINTLSLGLGLGLGLAALFSVIVYAILWWKKRTARALEKTLPEYKLGPPPVYSTSETHLGGEQGTETVVGEGTGGENGHEEVDSVHRLSHTL